MARKAHEPSEDQIHKAVLSYLDMCCTRSLIYWHTPNGGSRNIIEAAKLKAMGTRPGIPDVFILCEGHLYGLEIKTTTGRPSDTQKVTLNLLRVNGATTAVVYGLDDALRQLTEWGLIRHLLPQATATHAHTGQRTRSRARVPDQGRARAQDGQGNDLLVPAGVRHSGHSDHSSPPRRRTPRRVGPAVH